MAKAIIETQKKPGVMPDQTRGVLRKLSDSLRKAGGLAVPVSAPATKAGDFKAGDTKAGDAKASESKAAP
jgi:hypothetical protein